MSDHAASDRNWASTKGALRVQARPRPDVIEVLEVSTFNPA